MRMHGKKLKSLQSRMQHPHDSLQPLIAYKHHNSYWSNTSARCISNSYIACTILKSTHNSEKMSTSGWKIERKKVSLFVRCRLSEKFVFHKTYLIACLLYIFHLLSSPLLSPVSVCIAGNHWHFENARLPLNTSFHIAKSFATMNYDDDDDDDVKLNKKSTSAAHTTT